MRKCIEPSQLIYRFQPVDSRVRLKFSLAIWITTRLRDWKISILHIEICRRKVISLLILLLFFRIRNIAMRYVFQFRFNFYLIYNETILTTLLWSFRYWVAIRFFTATGSKQNKLQDLYFTSMANTNEPNTFSNV